MSPSATFSAFLVSLSPISSPVSLWESCVRALKAAQPHVLTLDGARPEADFPTEQSHALDFPYPVQGDPKWKRILSMPGLHLGPQGFQG